MLKKLNNFSIKSKMFANTAVLMLIIIAISIYSFNSMKKLGNELHHVANEDIPLIGIITAITEHQLEQEIHFERALRFAVLLEQQKNASNHFASEQKLFDALSKKVDAEIDAAKQLAEQIKSSSLDEEDAIKFAYIDDALKKIKRKHTDFEDHAHQIFKMISEGKANAIQPLVAGIEREEDQLNIELEKLLLATEKYTREAIRREQQQERRAAKNLVAFSLLSLLFGGLSSWLVGTSIVNRLSKCQADLGMIASGDLTQNIVTDGKDEIGDLQKSMQTMTDKLRTIVLNIENTTQQIDVSSNKSSEAAAQTSEKINQQQIETEEMANSINQMSVAIGGVAESANETSNASSELQAETVYGLEIVKKAVQSIHQLSTEINNTSTIVNEVEQHSDTINKVLAVIKAIAEQTNLLALNAAIEAARAGEQGRGFAVVADEVRTLAGRTQEATEEINHIIEILQSGSRNAVLAMSQSHTQADTVVKQVNLADSSLNKISRSVFQINEHNEQVATAAEEQNAVTGEINRNISRIKDIAKQNATGAETISIYAKEVATKSTELKALINQFKVS